MLGQPRHEFHDIHARPSRRDLVVPEATPVTACHTRARRGRQSLGRTVTYGTMSCDRFTGWRSDAGTGSVGAAKHCSWRLPAHGWFMRVYVEAHPTVAAHSFTLRAEGVGDPTGDLADVVIVAGQGYVHAARFCRG